MCEGRMCEGRMCEGRMCASVMEVWEKRLQDTRTVAIVTANYIYCDAYIPTLFTVMANSIVNAN